MNDKTISLEYFKWFGFQTLVEKVRPESVLGVAPFLSKSLRMPTLLIRVLGKKRPEYFFFHSSAIKEKETFDLVQRGYSFEQLNESQFDSQTIKTARIIIK